MAFYLLTPQTTGVLFKEESFPTLKKNTTSQLAYEGTQEHQDTPYFLAIQ